jgi:hypothetical protein
MIKIHPSPTADTRTCDWSKVTRETLLASSEQHIRDIRAGLAFFAEKLAEAGVRHDHDKITAIDHFHADFRSGFAQTGWWDNHRKVNRHHLTEADGIPADVNLVDVLDFITDCVMAGMARSGSVRPLTIDPAVLQRAFENTAALLCANVEVAPLPAPSAAPARETPPEHRWIETSDPFTPKCSACGVLDGDPLADQPCAAPPSDAGTETAAKEDAK